MTLGWQRLWCVPVTRFLFFSCVFFCLLLCSSGFECGMCEVVVCVWRGRAYWTSLVALFSRICPRCATVLPMFSDSSTSSPTLSPHSTVPGYQHAKHRSKAPLRICPPAGRPDHVWSRLPIYFPVRLRTCNGALLGAWTHGHQVSPRAPTASRVAQERASRPNITYDCAHINTHMHQARESSHTRPKQETLKEKWTRLLIGGKNILVRPMPYASRALLRLPCRHNRCRGEQNPCLPATAH